MVSGRNKMADQKTVQQIQDAWFVDPKTNGSHTEIEPEEFTAYADQVESEYHKQRHENWMANYQELLKNTFHRDQIQHMVKIRRDPNA